MGNLLLYAAFAASATLSLAQGTARLPQQPGRRFIRSGPIETLRAYQKYAKGNIPPEIVAAAANARAHHKGPKDGATGSSPNWPADAYSYQYNVPVQIGSQNFNLMWDTGSPTMWVYSVFEPAGETPWQNRYSPGPTADLLSGEKVSFVYSDGSATVDGDVYTDVVKFGGLTVPKQALGAITHASDIVTQAPFEGIIGAGFGGCDGIYPDHQKTWFDNIKNTLSEPLFTVDMKRGQQGSFDLGYIDPTKHTGSINYVPVPDSRCVWTLTVGGSSAESEPISGSIGGAFVDTGTPLIYLPEDALKSYYSHIPSAVYSDYWAAWVIDCDATLPDWNVQIGSETYTVPGRYMNYAPNVDDDGSIDGTCYAGIQAGPSGESVLGEIFIDTVFVVHDFTNGSPRLGFAPKALYS
ncbi:aspartic endopeptidase pep1 like protein [Zymoseptoria brevis]|uniref:Aspartic endopeptidase pep1 like protein n=1 Tax=Zymoseptoria brevis TaxID=1047168 RepID=A0A0F4GKP8_9PEZI|nr:aspartic endopeptidase pep1 like protein [Zymoseptoria brevis]